jgi:EAL domain-containing protein (putative c-di-GMP-specific phosphodiesterase class I)
VSPKQLADPSFPELVVDTLTRHSLPPEAQGFQILEVALLDVVAAKGVMKHLRAVGIALALDDSARATRTSGGSRTCRSPD